jgi:ABC-type multidrug transport system fused ATPase/permease subunit
MLAEIQKEASESSKKKQKEKEKKRNRSMEISSSKISSQSEEKRSKRGKMMTDENLEDSRVGLDGYKRFLGYLGGWRFIILSQLSMIGFSVFKILSDYQVGHWATSPEQSKDFAYYSSLTFLYATLNSFFTFLRSFILMMSGWYAARKIHRLILHKVLNAPINLYFDVTPIGRILNRFSKDLNVLE